MARQVGTILIMRPEFLDREETALRENGIETAAGVSFAEDKTVAGRMLRLSRMDMQDAAVEDSEDVGARKNSTDMGAASGAGHAESVNADLFRERAGVDFDRVIDHMRSLRLIFVGATCRVDRAHARHLDHGLCRKWEE